IMMTHRALLFVPFLAAVVAANPCAAQTPTPASDSTAAATGAASSPVAPAETPPPVIAAPPTPPDFPRGRISGYLFGDTYYNLVADPTHAYGASGADAGQTNLDAAKPITKDLNGIQVRRVYFQLDNDLTVRYATRFRLEMDGKALSSDGKITTFVKNAYFLAK